MAERNLALFHSGAQAHGSLEADAAASHAPLAERLRPRRWEDFSGLERIDAALVRQLKAGLGRPPSLIFWGPPGCGKTTLARLVGRSFDARFVEVSAVLVGVKEIRTIAEEAKHEPRLTILFVDELHRLSKSQQDAFLPHVEAGTFVLFGATTENPSFYLTNALRSRARILTLEAHAPESLRGILERAAAFYEVSVEATVFELLPHFSGGDARQLLNIVESAVQTGELANGAVLTKEIFERHARSHGIKRYDRDGDEHYALASAFIKSMRGSDPDAALYYAFRMIEAGEDPRFLIRRMMIFASEDIGNADPRALMLAVSTSEAFERLGMPEGRIPFAHCVTYLACAPKSNRSYLAMHAAVAAVKQYPHEPVPAHLRNAPTDLMKSMGFGKEYHYPHEAEGGVVKGEQYLPESLRGNHFYEPSDRGVEKHFGEQLTQLRQAQASSVRGKQGHKGGA